MKKSKIFLIFALALLVASMLVSCGGSDDAVTTVTEEEWYSELNSLYEGNFCATSLNERYSSAIVVRDNLVKAFSVAGDISQTVYYANENGLTYIYENKNDVWYKYPDINDSWTGGIYDGCIVPWEDTHGWYTAGVVDDTVPIELLDFKLFEFYEPAGTYRCENIEIKYEHGTSDFLKNISVSFSDGKLIGLSLDFCDDTEGNPIYHVTFSLLPDDVNVSLPDFSKVVSLPTDYSQSTTTVTTIDTEFDWRNALILFSQKDSFYFKDSNITATILSDKIEVVEDGRTVYYANENGLSFLYVKDGEEWMKVADVVGSGEEETHQSWNERYSNSIQLYVGYYANEILCELYDIYEEFEYDSENKVYTLAEYESDRGGEVFENLKVSFENGEVKSISFEFYWGDALTEVHLTTASANSITLPVISE